MSFKKFSHFFLTNHSPRQIFIKNFSWESGSDLLIRLIKFILIPISAQVLGPEQFGLLYYYIAIATLFFMCSGLGVDSVYLQTVQTSPSPKVLESRFFYTCLYLKIIFYIIALLGYYWVPLPPLEKTLYLIAIHFLLFDQIKRIFFSMVYIRLKKEVNATIFIIENIITSLIGLVLLFKYQSVTLYFLSILLGPIISIAIYLYWFSKHHLLPKKVTLSRYQVWNLIKKGLPFLATTIVVSAYSSTDTLLVRWLSNSHQLGIYQAALKLILASYAISIAVSHTLSPMLTQYSNQLSKFTSLFRNGLTILFLTGLPLSLLTFVSAKPLTLFLFGNTYLEAIPALQVGSFIIGLSFMTSILNHGLIARRKEVQNMKLSISTISINITLTYFLVPIMGITGAILGTLVATMIDLIFSGHWMIKDIGVQCINRRSWIIGTIAATISTMGLYFLLQFPLHILISYSIMILLYVILLLIFKEPLLQKAVYLLKKNT